MTPLPPRLTPCNSMLGSITLANLFEYLEEPQSIFTEALLEVNGKLK